ncbi:MAG: hypothetical protein Pars93KO_25550 [Parasphingorhabdus sp.]
MSNSVTFFELGRSYLESGRILSEATDFDKSTFYRDEPIDLLFAHAYELMLKGCSLVQDPKRDPRKYGHGLLTLYDDLRSDGFLGDLIINVENSVRNRWKCHLRYARDKYVDSLGLVKLKNRNDDTLGV